MSTNKRMRKSEENGGINSTEYVNKKIESAGHKKQIRLLRKLLNHKDWAVSLVAANKLNSIESMKNGNRKKSELSKKEVMTEEISKGLLPAIALSGRYGC
ncbi:MAG: hypothetical protein QW590_03335 [Candidatus Bilamarchaeaceae archaeon]